MKAENTRMGDGRKGIKKRRKENQEKEINSSGKRMKQIETGEREKQKRKGSKEGGKARKGRRERSLESI